MPALHAHMAAEGVRLAMERFSADRIVPQYEALVRTHARTLESRAGTPKGLEQFEKQNRQRHQFRNKPSSSRNKDQAGSSSSIR